MPVLDATDLTAADAKALAYGDHRGSPAKRADFGDLRLCNFRHRMPLPALVRAVDDPVRKVLFARRPSKVGGHVVSPAPVTMRRLKAGCAGAGKRTQHQPMNERGASTDLDLQITRLHRRREKHDTGSPSCLTVAMNNRSGRRTNSPLAAGLISREAGDLSPLFMHSQSISQGG